MSIDPGMIASAPARTHSVPIGEIVAGLARDIEAVCRQLLPGGRRSGAEWTVSGDASPLGCSMAVHLTGSKAGVWGAWSASQSGDALDLVAAIACGGDKTEAIRWSKSWLGLDGASHGRGLGVRPWAARPPGPGPDPQPDTGRLALRLYLEARPSLKDTPAARYLAGRGLALEHLGRQPRALRYHPTLYNPDSRRQWPALIAAIIRAGKTVAVHRTWLTEDGKKAPVANPKMTLGPYKGGLIPLWRGHSGKALRDAPAGDRIILSEGIEDGLSCAIAAPECRVAAAVSLPNLGAVELPPAIATVLIASQNDPWWHERQARDHPTRLGLEKAIRRFQAEGREVRLIRAAGGKDVNDLLRGAAL